MIIEIILKKRCSKCGVEKPRDDFHKDKHNTDGLRSHCKACARAQKKAWYEANKDKIKARSKAWYEANKDKRNAQVKAYYEANKEKLKAQQKAWREANKDKVKAYGKANKDKKKAYNKAWCEVNKGKRRDYKRAYQAKRLKEDPIYKLKLDMRIRVGKLLKGQKSKKTEEIIGCSYGQLYLHLNYANLKEPSHDHIIPLNWADTEEELYALFRWENLQGMEFEENIEKGNRYCDKKRAEQVASIHPQQNVIEQILSRQTKTKNQYIKK